MADLNAGQVTLEVRAVSDKLAADMQTAKNKITPAVNSLERTSKINMSNLTTSLTTVSNIMPGIAGGAVAAASGIDALKVALVGFETAAAPLMAIAITIAAIEKAASFAKTAMESAAKRETLVTTYEALLKDKKAAEDLVNQMQKLADRTPLETSDIANAGRLLLAMGFNVKEVIPLIEDVGNAAVASGKGAEGMMRLALIIGQIRAKGRLQGEELMQLNEAGLNPLKQIGDAVGKTGSDLQKMISDGKVSADIAIKAIRKNMTDSFGDAMAKTSDTYDGAISNMNDAWDKFKIAMGKPIITDIKPFIQDVAKGLNLVTSKVDKIEASFNRIKDISAKIALFLAAPTMFNTSSKIYDEYKKMQDYVPPSRKLKSPEEPEIFKREDEMIKAAEKEKKRAAEALPKNLEALKVGEKMLADMVKERTDREKASAREIYDAIKQRAQDSAQAVVDGLRKQYEAHQQYAQRTMAIYTNMANASAGKRERMVITNASNFGKNALPDFVKFQDQIAMAGETLLSARYLGIPQSAGRTITAQPRFSNGQPAPQLTEQQVISELKGIKKYLYDILQSNYNTRQQAVLS